MKQRQSVLTLLAMLALLGLTAGCTDGASGEALPSEAADSTSPAGTTESSTNVTNPFTGMKACNLLDRAMQGMGYPPGEVAIAASDNGCQTSKPQVATYSLYLQPAYPLEQFGQDPSKLHDGEVNGRSAVQRREDNDLAGACDIAIAVPPNDTAIVGLTRTNGTTDEACKLVTELAKKIEPMLPGGK